MPHKKAIWTIGHSTHTLEEFLAMLEAFEITVLADIRNFPGSRRYPHFNKDALELSLPANGISYHHLKALGGRRRPVPGSHNSAWRNDAFRGYADYMETPDFLSALKELKTLATGKRLAYMCSEAVWWRCHRSLVSDFFKHEGWTVMHILSPVKADEHPYTSPARIVDGRLTYAALL
jgi:uncharacterized protein (DUF488 family)